MGVLLLVPVLVVVLGALFSSKRTRGAMLWVGVLLATLLRL